ncbi:hypothetical protein F5Y04DRAFT_265604 [Hypomontagnella monticulosa]|nr:hypothetical protein F5Y04DRAFT_265604 [Hypomontagnella monticulosa]
MAPLTRRQARQTEETTENEVISTPSETVEQNEVSHEKDSISSHGKRKSIDNNNISDDDGAAPPDLEAASPKRQRLAVRTREDESTGTGRKTHIEVEIPVNSQSKRDEANTVPDSQDAEDEPLEVGFGSGPEAEPSSASKQLEEEASQRLASLSAEPEYTPMPKPKAKHVVFGDDDDVDKFVTAAAAAEVDKKAEDEDAKDEDSDDDAPEAVSTQTVAKEMQKAALAATEAAEKQASSLKRKRQEKDSLYKQQAERRKRARGTVEVHQTEQPASGELGSDEDDNDDTGMAEVETAVTAGRRRAQKKFNLPAVLPAEFLTDSSSEDEADETALKKRKIAKKPTKITFGENAEDNTRKRDCISGDTRYRVLETQGTLTLAPKAHKNSRISKESLLRRKRSGVATGQKKGFFVKK